MKANGYAFLDRSGEVDLDSIAETQDGVRLRCLEASMGWRFDHPSRYDHEKEWQRLLTYGSVVPISISVALDEAKPSGSGSK
jgi:hypothetical protein